MTPKINARRSLPVFYRYDVHDDDQIQRYNDIINEINAIQETYDMEEKEYAPLILVHKRLKLALKRYVNI